MKKINKNELAVKVAKKEAGKKQVNIAQIKEILKSLIDVAIEEGMITKEMFETKKKK